MKVMAAALLAGAGLMAGAQSVPEECRLRFNADGNFKIMQLTDLHYMDGNPKTFRSVDAVEALIGLEHPDLIVVTGDLVDPPLEESVPLILKPLESSGMPYAVVYGNHDGGTESRAVMARLVGNAQNCLNRYADGERGGSNLALTLWSQSGDSLCRALYMLDSKGYSTDERVGAFDHVTAERIAWYRHVSDSVAASNGGVAVPALMFFHIPLPELKTAKDEGEICGTRTWNEVTPSFSNGLFLAAVEQGDVDGMFFGHDHGNDYSVNWHGILLAYGRYTGCVERIPGLQPQGARIIELTESTPEFKTYIRLMDGTIEQSE